MIPLRWHAEGEGMSPEAQSIGNRIKAARIASGMKQEELARAVGFASRQILSDLERGVRDVRAAEAARIARALRLDLSALLTESPARPRVLWREQPADGGAGIEAAFLQWCDRQRRVLALLDQRAPDQLPSYERDLAQMTYADADRLARDVGRSLDLGARPARALDAALQSQYDVTIWYLDTPPGCSACTRGAHGVSILVPRGEAPWRRHFDMAHELFHLLTWDASAREMALTGAAAPTAHTEKLANAFAASLLLPGELLLRALDERSAERRVKLAELVALARDFGVSLDTLLWRLHNLGCWRDRDAVDDLRGNPRLRELDRASQADAWWEPTCLPERFVQFAYAATLRGRLSRSQLATYLECGLSDLPRVLSTYGIDDDSAELAAWDIPLECATGDLDAMTLPSEQQ